MMLLVFFIFSSRRRHTRWPRDWSSDVCSSDLEALASIGLEIAGIKNNYHLPVSFQKKKDYFITSATLPLNINDFNLEQPRKLFGLIVVHKEIEITFDLRFRLSSE